MRVHRLGITGTLGKALLAANPIESAIEVVKHHANRARLWRRTSLVALGRLGLVRAENRFRRVKSDEEIPQPVATLENVVIEELKGRGTSPGPR